MNKTARTLILKFVDFAFTRLAGYVNYFLLLLRTRYFRPLPAKAATV